MQVKLESTNKIESRMCSAPVRLWVGTLDDGTPVRMWVLRIETPENAGFDNAAFQARLESSPDRPPDDRAPRRAYT